MAVRFALSVGLMLLQFSLQMGEARGQTEWLEVVSVVPSLKIDHEIDIRGKFEDEKHPVLLRGPQFLSMAVGGNDVEVQQETYLTWFQMPPALPDKTSLWVRDPWQTDQKLHVNFGNALYLLFPAQSITTGSPSDLPAGISCFQAFKITKETKYDKKVKLTGSLGTGERTIKELIFVCFPAEQWHHADHIPVINWDHCLLVFSLESQPVTKDFSTIDAFGLNKLTTNSTQWLCVPSDVVAADEAKKPK